MQVYVDTLVKKAYDNWNQVVEYDGKSLLSFKQVRRSSRNEPQTAALEYSNPLDHQLQLPRLPVSFTSEQPSADSGLPVGGNACCVLVGPLNICPMGPFCAMSIILACFASHFCLSRK